MTRAEIAALFAERDATAARLAKLDATLAAEARPYWLGKGYRVLPRIENFRREICGQRVN